VIMATSLIRAFLGAVLVISGIGKVLDSDGTQRAVAGYGVSGRSGKYLAAGLPCVEVLTGSLLLLQIAPVIVPVWTTLVFITFSIAIVKAIARGGSMNCHCFGALTRETVSKVTAVRTFCLVILSVAVAIYFPLPSLGLFLPRV
jgi:uncharacterized membrane protein YphA (DoxX/SURF4 family)